MLIKKRKKIVHAYFTDGYYKWAKVFMESFRRYNDHPVILSTRNLPNLKRRTLKKFGNVKIRNKNLNFDKLAKKAKISTTALMQFKSKTEIEKVNAQCRVWKLMIPGDDRPKEVREVVSSLDKNDLLLHLDIDSYFKKSVDPWFDIIKQNDFTSVSRYHNQMKKFDRIKNPHMVIIICIMGFKVNENSKEFLDRWMEEIDDVPAYKRKRGYGQTSCYNALKEIYPDFFEDRNYSLREKLLNYFKKNKNFEFGMIPHEDIHLGGILSEDRILYGANRGSKNDVLRKYQEDLKK